MVPFPIEGPKLVEYSPGATQQSSGYATITPPGAYPRLPGGQSTHYQQSGHQHLQQSGQQYLQQSGHQHLQHSGHQHPQQISGHPEQHQSGQIPTSSHQDNRMFSGNKQVLRRKQASSHNSNNNNNNNHNFKGQLTYHQRGQLGKKVNDEQAVISTSPDHTGGHAGQKKLLSAQELTGAPLISYASRNRKLKKKLSEPVACSNGEQLAGHPVHQVGGHPVQQAGGHPVHQVAGHHVQQVAGHHVQQLAGHSVQQVAGPPVQQMAGYPVQQLGGHPVHQVAGHHVQQVAGHPVHQNLYLGVYTYTPVNRQEMYHNSPLSEHQHQSTAINNFQNSGQHSRQESSQQHYQSSGVSTAAPTSAKHQQGVSTGVPASAKHQQGGGSKTCDSMFDSHSVSSEDMDHFVPRIIRPRRRRKKDRKEKALQNLEEVHINNKEDGDINKREVRMEAKVRGESKTGGHQAGGHQTGGHGDEPEILGSEKQWLPQGLLSAESSYDSRSESGSSVEETGWSGHRKLSAAVSMPVYPSYAAPIYFNPINKSSETSDYNSLTSNSSEYHSSEYHSSNYNSSDTHGSDNQCDSDSRSEANSTPSLEDEEKESVKNIEVDQVASRQDKPALVKSTSSSFFRSPKMSGRDDIGGVSPGEMRKRNLRKTNSWHPVTHQDDSMATFSLFSPAGSIDLLSGIRKNLSKLDVNSETE